MLLRKLDLPEGQESLGVCPGMLQRGLTRRSSLTGLASVRSCAACQEAVGIVWVCFPFLPQSLSSLLKKDTFKVDVPFRKPLLPSVLLLSA